MRKNKIHVAHIHVTNRTFSFVYVIIKVYMQFHMQHLLCSAVAGTGVS